MIDNSEKTTEKSLSDITGEIYDMIVELLYVDIHAVNYEDEAIDNLLWTTFDLWFGYLNAMLEGRCSLKESIEFDLEKEVMGKYAEISDLYNRRHSLASNRKDKEEYLTKTNPQERASHYV